MARKMKDSGIEWIGEIPEGWEVIPAKFLFKNSDIRRIADDEQLTSSQQFGIISQKDYTELTGSKVVLANKGLADWKHVEPFDFIISLRSFQGGLEMSEITGCITWHYIVLKPCHKICSYYYKWLFKSDSYIRALQRTCSFIRDGQDLRYSNFIQVPLFEPPLAEQEKIADYLNAECFRIDAMLTKTRSSIEEYKKLKQAVITQAVTKGVRGERKMKASGVEWIGEIPKEWVCEKIKYATSISRGLFNHRPRNDERYYNGKYPFIQTGDVANATKYIVSYSQTLNELGKSVSKEFPKGTLTMTIAANVGEVAILNFDAYFPDSVVGFIPNKNIRTLYLFYVFSAMKDEFTRTAIKSTQLNLNIDRVKETFIPVTLDSNEQCEIENYLESKCAEIDGLIAKKEQLVKELESYKKSLIYEVVTGKREV